MKRVIIFTGIFLVIHCMGYAQSDQQCIRQLKQYNKKMNSIGMPEGNKVYYFNYTLTSDMRVSGGIETKTYNVRFYMAAHQMHYITKDIEIYQDTTDAFIVQHENKIVIRANSAYKRDMNKRYNEIVMLKDSVFNVMQLKQCRQSEDKRETVIMLETKPELKDKFDINSITYHYDPGNKLVNKTITLYDKHFKAKRMIVELNNMDLNYKINMHKPARSLFLDKEGRLTGKYAGYRLLVNN